MTSPEPNTPLVAIACGGTGGHLFPGLAVAEELQKRGCKIALLISPKEIDQQAVKAASGMVIYTLPAVALQNRNYFSFIFSFWKSWRAAKNIFQVRPPHAVLGMGGFTSAPPILAGNALGAKTFLHESNAVPGRANRFLSRFVGGAFIGFPEAAARLKARNITTTGTPVRAQFFRGAGVSPANRRQDACAAFDLDPNLPTILVVGGSQGASGLNEMMLSALPLLAAKNWQFLHLAGAKDFDKVSAAYAGRGIKAVVKPFFAEMDLALGAVTVTVSRAGASSLAEIAAMRLPALLVPFPAAADNHQFFNASAFEKNGASKLLEQRNSTPEKVAAILEDLVGDEAARSRMQAALAQWHAPRAAEQIAGIMLAAIECQQAALAAKKSGCSCGCAHGREKHATG